MEKVQTGVVFVEENISLSTTAFISALLPSHTDVKLLLTMPNTISVSSREKRHRLDVRQPISSVFAEITKCTTNFTLLVLQSLRPFLHDRSHTGVSKLTSQLLAWRRDNPKSLLITVLPSNLPANLFTILSQCASAIYRPHLRPGGPSLAPLCEVIITKSSSKRVRKVITYDIVKGEFVDVAPFDQLRQTSDMIEANMVKVDSGGNVKKGLDTTFDMGLKLTESEQRAKSSVPLPYTAAQEGGSILYEGDAADDLDEDDPDDDLMI